MIAQLRGKILQKNQILNKIKSNSVKKLLKEFSNLSKKDSKKYEEFYLQYHHHLLIKLNLHYSYQVYQLEKFF